MSSATVMPPWIKKNSFSLEKIPRLAKEDTIVNNGQNQIISHGKSKLKFYTFDFAKEMAHMEHVIIRDHRIGFGHGDCAICVAKELVFVFGGMVLEQHRNDLFCYERAKKKWRRLDYKVSANVPDACHSSSMVHREATNSLLVFGGSVTGDAVTNLCYEYDVTSQMWTSIETNASIVGRCNASGAYRRQTDSVVYFGGYLAYQTYTNDLDEYNFANNTWYKHSALHGPSPQYKSSVLIPHSDDSRMFVCSGNGTSGIPEQGLFEYSFVSLRWKKYHHTEMCHHSCLLFEAKKNKLWFANLTTEPSKVHCLQVPSHSKCDIFPYMCKRQFVDVKIVFA